MLSLFVSYVAEDAAFARRLANDLTRAGLRVWLAENELIPGESWVGEIVGAIRQSDYFLLVLSASSVHSGLVSSEVNEAFLCDAEAGSKRIILIRVDDTEPPDFASKAECVDFRVNYESGLRTLLFLVSTVQDASVRRLSDILAVEKVALRIGKEHTRFKGAGHYVMIVLTLLTLLVTLGTAIPPFYELIRNRPKIYFSRSTSQVITPPGIDEEYFHDVLKKNRIADSTLRVDIVNMGDVAAGSVKVGVSVPGTIEYTKPVPTPDVSMVWVKLETEYEAGNSPSKVKFCLTELVPEKIVSLLVGYQVTDNAVGEHVNVIYDGRKADEVPYISDAPKYPAIEFLRLPFRICGFGLIISFLISIAWIVYANARAREGLLLILKQISPAFSRLVEAWLNFLSK